MDIDWTPATILWALGGWLAMTLAGLAIAAAVVTSLPHDFFQNPAPAAGRGSGSATLRRVGRNAVGLVLIALGLVLSIPGVPGQGIITVLAGVLLVDFPGRHRVAVALARLPGVLETLNRIRRRFQRPPLLAPGPPRPHAERVVILGAAGRDFHDFNVVYRDDPSVVVVAFTAAQIPGIAHRRYPPVLAGPRYPGGIPIEDETVLEELCRRERVHRVVFAYSDVSHAHVMSLACRALAAGADFTLLGPERTMLRAAIPVVAVSAVRTGCGKSPIARWLGRRLREGGRRVAAVRHPMPYGQLERQRVQRFATLDDLTAADCTIEEREEYEPHVAAGTVVFAGADYAEVIARAAAEADVIVWDGGNNDFPFVRPDLHIVVADALRPDHARGYYPGEAVIRTADVVVVNKVNAAPPADVARAIEDARQLNPRAAVVRGALGVRLDAPERVRGRRAIVVEDGPTITHGSMPHGAGLVAATSAGAAAIVDPRGAAVPEIAAVYAQYPHIGPVLPAVGYSAAQVAALQATLERADADVVVAATPVDLGRLVTVSKPIVRARYDFEDADEPGLAALVDRWTARTWPAR